jgi:hypothetical protein
VNRALRFTLLGLAVVVVFTNVLLELNRYYHGPFIGSASSPSSSGSISSPARTTMIERDVSLACTECRDPAPPGAVGWLAYLTLGDEDAEDVAEVAVYCPGCADREFDRP